MRYRASWRQISLMVTTMASRVLVSSSQTALGQTDSSTETDSTSPSRARTSATPTTPHLIPTPLVSLDRSVILKRVDGDSVRNTPTNEVYGMCWAAFPHSDLEDCNIDYDYLMRFRLNRV